MCIIGTIDRLNKKGYSIPNEAGDILLIGHVLEAITKGPVEPELEETTQGKVYIGQTSLSIPEYLNELNKCCKSKNPSGLLVKRLTGKRGNISFFFSEVLGLIGLAC